MAMASSVRYGLHGFCPWHPDSQWAKIRKKCNLGKPNYLPQRLKTTFFEMFSNGVVPKGLAE